MERWVDQSWEDVTVGVYAALIRSRIHFAQAAYRDGEWHCILGTRGGNCNGEKYSPELGAMLRDTLLRPVGQWCVFWWSHDSKGRRVRKGALKWLDEHRPPVSWIADRPIGRAMEAGRAAPFWRAVAERRVVLVGPKHLARQDLLRVDSHIVVPDGTAWKHLDEICGNIRGELHGDPIVLFASGMASNVMIHRLWSERPAATLYDIGAALDPYAGVFSRGEYASVDWRANRKELNRP